MWEIDKGGTKFLRVPPKDLGSIVHLGTIHSNEKIHGKHNLTSLYHSCGN